MHHFVIVYARNRINGPGQGRGKVLVDLRLQGATRRSNADALRTSAGEMP
jgi:hypothetical protein